MVLREAAAESQIKHRQHYIPEFYIKNFYGADNKLCSYVVKFNSSKRKTSSEICYLDYLYETRWNEGEDSFILTNQIENHFAEKETKYAETVRRVLAVCRDKDNENALVCSTNDREILISLVANLYVRNPLTLQSAQVETVSESIKESDEYSDTKGLFDSLGLDINIDSIIKAAQKRIWLDDTMDESIPLKVQKELKTLKMSFIVSKDKPFIFTSFPVLVQVDEQNKLKLAILPLSPDCAVMFSEISIDKLNRNRMHYMDNIGVEKLNKMLILSGAKKIDYIMARDRQEIDNVLKQIGENDDQTGTVN